MKRRWENAIRSLGWCSCSRAGHVRVRAPRATGSRPGAGSRTPFGLWFAAQHALLRPNPDGSVTRIGIKVLEQTY